MPITLSPQLEALVIEKVEAGNYEDAEAVVREALFLLDDRDRLQQLRASIEESERQFERGEYDEWSPELWEQIMAEGEEMYRKGIKPSPDVCP